MTPQQQRAMEEMDDILRGTTGGAALWCVLAAGLGVAVALGVWL